MRLFTIFLFLFFASLFSQSVAAQTTCTANVPEKTCKHAITIFNSFSSMEKFPKIVISDPASFAKKAESLKSEFKVKEIKMNSKQNGQSSAPFSFDMGDDILLVFGNGGCPESIFISTDRFRPLKLVYLADGKTLDTSKTHYTDGFDPRTVVDTASLMKGYLLGCRIGAMRSPCCEIH